VACRYRVRPEEPLAPAFFAPDRLVGFLDEPLVAAFLGGPTLPTRCAETVFRLAVLVVFLAAVFVALEAAAGRLISAARWAAVCAFIALASAFFAFRVAFFAASIAFLAETSAARADFFAVFVADLLDMVRSIPVSGAGRRE